MSGARPRGGMKSITRTAPRVGLPLGLEHERVRPVAPAGLPGIGPRRDDPAAVVGVPEQRREAGAGVEARKARPVDRAVAPDERCRLQVADEAVVLDARHQRSSISSAKRRKRFSTALVEGGDVLLRCVIVECRGEVVAQVGEDFRPRLDEIDIVAVPFLGFVAFCAVVRALCGDAVVDQSALLSLEEVELSLDQVGEARTSQPHTSCR